jgi:hypothetical protein
MQFGDLAHAHRDASLPAAEHNVTALLYVNEPWESAFAGETVFFDDDEEARLAVLPKAGRLLLFTAAILHVGRPPSRLVWGQRFTTAIKFVGTPHTHTVAG